MILKTSWKAWAVVGIALVSAAANANGAGGRESDKTVFTLSTGVKRIVVARVPNGADLLESLNQAVQSEGVRNAAIVSGTGSLTQYHVHTVGNTTLPPENVFRKDEGPWDLLTVMGYVIDGRVHAHITIVDDEKAFGGHLEPGTRVFTFAIVTFAEVDDGASLAGFDDWRWDGSPEGR